MTYGQTLLKQEKLHIFVAKSHDKVSYSLNHVYIVVYEEPNHLKHSGLCNFRSYCLSSDIFKN
jgi:hypothetical protein